MIDLNMSFKKTYTDQIRTRYINADKGGKAKILDEYCNICNYNRKHAIRALNSPDTHEPKRPRKGPQPKYPQEEILVAAKNKCPLWPINKCPLFGKY